MPDAANGYVTKPEKGKRFDSDYSAKEMAAVVKAKVDRAAGGRTIVYASDG